MPTIIAWGLVISGHPCIHYPCKYTSVVSFDHYFLTYIYHEDAPVGLGGLI